MQTYQRGSYQQRPVPLVGVEPETVHDIVEVVGGTQSVRLSMWGLVQVIFAVAAGTVWALHAHGKTGR